MLNDVERGEVVVLKLTGNLQGQAGPLINGEDVVFILRKKK